MIPFFYPTLSPTACPALFLSNDLTMHDEDTEEENHQDAFASLPTNMVPPNRAVPPTTALSHTVHIDRQPSSSSSPPSSSRTTLTQAAREQGTFRLRMSIAGFHPDELNVTIRHGRVIVRGRHTVQASIPPMQTSSFASGSNAEETEDTEPDFISQSFKRTFILPPNADIRKAHAQFLPQQEELVVEVPFRNLVMSSTIPAPTIRRRPMDVFLTFVTILLVDRAMRITYEQFLLHERTVGQSSSN